MTINITKKQIIIALSAIVVILVGVFGYNAYRASQYEKNTEHFKEYSYKLYLVSTNLCSQINSVWSGYIFDDKHYFGPKSGGSYSSSYSSVEEPIYCSNFSEIILHQEVFFTRKGFIKLMDEYRKEMKESFEKMTPPPGKYKDEHETMQKMYNAVNALCNCAVKPDGSLQSYTALVRENDKKFLEAIEQSEIELCPIENKRSEYQQTVIKAVQDRLGSLDD